MAELLAHERAAGWRLRLERFIAAPQERVFAAFVDANELKQWWGPKAFTVPRLEFDVVEGARYRITMQPPDGNAFHLGGMFRVVEPPYRLIFTFVWEEPDPDDRETVVTLSFEPTGEGTKLVLDQEPFQTAPRWQLHRDGWTDTIERLALFVE